MTIPKFHPRSWVQTPKGGGQVQSQRYVTAERQWRYTVTLSKPERDQEATQEFWESELKEGTL